MEIPQRPNAFEGNFVADDRFQKRAAGAIFFTFMQFSRKFGRIIGWHHASTLGLGTVKHPAGRALTSDWFANSFLMVVYENFFKL